MPGIQKSNNTKKWCWVLPNLYGIYGYSDHFVVKREYSIIFVSLALVGKEENFMWLIYRLGGRLIHSRKLG